MIDTTKEYRTRESGYPVTIWTTTARGKYPVRGLIHKRVEDMDMSWCADGACVGSFAHKYDLIEVTPKVVRWINVYETYLGASGCLTRESADSTARKNRIAVLRIEFDPNTHTRTYTEEPV